MSEDIRPAAAAGSFYGDDAGMLEYQLNQIRLPGREPLVHGCMVPHAGYVFSMPTALRTLAPARGSRIERAVIIGPSHHAAFTGVAAADYKAWETPFGAMPLDEEGLALLKSAALPELRIDNEPHRQEHSIEVQLPLIRHLFGALPFLPLLTGGMDCRCAGILGEALARLDTPGTLWVISGDFTHYGKSFGYAPFGLPCPVKKLNALDREAAEHIARRDLPALTAFLRRTHAAICGIAPAALYLRMLEHSGRRAEGEVLSVTDSSIASGDLNHVVGYAGILFREVGPCA